MISPVTYDNKSLLVNGNRVWLTSGSMHYWRTPHQSWRDRLEKAKSYGLNCIQTYVYWGVHEPKQGQYDFTGDLDLDAFLALCAELDLYVIARPGPYICAEVSMGGFPAWMLSKRGLEFRRTNSLYIEEVSRWFERLVPIIAERQVGREGSVILFQIENELSCVRRSEEEARLYMQILHDLSKRLGIQVPIITCEGSAEGAVECINSHKPADRFEEYRKKQPGAPLLSTEFWPYWYHTWETPPDWMLRTPQQLAYETWRFIAEGGAGYNHYMWHGGTNFGWTAMYGQTTDYDHVGVLEESGEVHDRARIPAVPAKTARSLANVLSASEPSEPGLKSNDSELKIFTRDGENGRIHFILNPTEETRTAKFQDTKGNQATIEIPSLGARTWLEKAKMDETLIIKKSTAHIHLAVQNQEGWIIALASPPKDESHHFIYTQNKKEQCITIQHTKKKSVSTHQFGKKNLVIVVVPQGGETRLHPLSSGVVVGGDWVQETEKGALLQSSGSNEKIDYIPTNGKPKALSIKPPKETLWKLSPWRWAEADSEADPGFLDLDWKLDLGPLSMDLHGDHEGYAWYRSSFEIKRQGVQELFLTAYADRVSVYLNGLLIHQTEPPPEDRPATPSARVPLGFLEEGTHSLALLVENMGHIKGEWQINRRAQLDLWMHDDLKGLLGPVLVEGTLPIQPWRYRPGLSIEDEAGIKTKLLTWQPLDKGKPRGMRYLRSILSCKADPHTAPVYLTLHGLSKGLLWLNGRLVGRVYPERDYSEQWLPDAWLERRNEIVLLEESKAGPQQIGIRLGPQRIPIL